MNSNTTRARRSRSQKADAQVGATATLTRPRPNDDELMLLPEVAAYVRRTENTLRYLRHLGGDDAPPLWRQGRRLVAWKSEINAWLDAQRAADLND